MERWLGWICVVVVVVEDHTGEGGNLQWGGPSWGAGGSPCACDTGSLRMTLPRWRSCPRLGSVWISARPCLPASPPSAAKRQRKVCEKEEEADLIQNVPIKNKIKSSVEHPAHNYCNKTNIKLYKKASPKTFRFNIHFNVSSIIKHSCLLILC